jgi:hypothetical protein
MMIKFLFGVVVGIMLATWGVGGIAEMVGVGVGKVQHGANVIHNNVTRQ